MVVTGEGVVPRGYLRCSESCGSGRSSKEVGAVKGKVMKMPL